MINGTFLLKQYQFSDITELSHTIQNKLKTFIEIGFLKSRQKDYKSA